MLNNLFKNNFNKGGANMLDYDEMKTMSEEELNDYFSNLDDSMLVDEWDDDMVEDEVNKTGKSGYYFGNDDEKVFVSSIRCGDLDKMVCFCLELDERVREYVGYIVEFNDDGYYSYICGECDIDGILEYYDGYNIYISTDIETFKKIFGFNTTCER